MIEQYPDDEGPQKSTKEDDTIYDQIIIEPADGVWICYAGLKKIAAAAFTLSKKVSPDLNLWLIGYDKDQFGAQNDVGPA